MPARASQAGQGGKNGAAAPRASPPEMRETYWDGPPIKRRGADTHYAGCVLGDERFKLGDRVLLSNASEDGQGIAHVLARIDNFWEDVQGVSWIEVTWFYFPEELHCGRLEAHGAREVFESHTSDETELASIVRKVAVLSKDEYDALPAAQRADEDTYFCRYHYDPTRRKFMPILQSLKKASLGGLESFKAQGKDRLMAFPDVLDTKKYRTRSHAVAALEDDGNAEEEAAAHASSAAAVEVDDACEFSRANYALQLSAVPAEMPCREGEQAEMRSVLRDAIRQGHSSGCIYISGVPGTGKTASVHALVRELKSEAESGKLAPFIYIEINAQRLPSPKSVYSLLLQGLTGRRVPAAQAAVELNAYFNSGKQCAKRPCCVLLVDELDHLVTRKQTVLYNSAHVSVFI